MQGCYAIIELLRKRFKLKSNVMKNMHAYARKSSRKQKQRRVRVQIHINRNILFVKSNMMDMLPTVHLIK